MDFPKDLKYTDDHEWIKIEGKTGIIGITDHAQSELGDVVYVDLPDDVEEVAKGDTMGTIEAVKTVADINAPVGGKIIERNESLNDAPETVNNDPYGDGWMVKIEIADESELEDLMDVDAYKEIVGQ